MGLDGGSRASMPAEGSARAGNDSLGLTTTRYPRLQPREEKVARRASPLRGIAHTVGVNEVT